MYNIEEVWSKVKDSPGIEKSMCLYDSNNHLLLLGNCNTFKIPLASLSLKLESSQSIDLDKNDIYVGFELSYELRVYDEREASESHYALLKCNDEKFNSYFLKFAEKLIEELSVNKNSANALVRFIENWTEFFKKKRKDLLKIEEIVGLYGELKYLKYLIEHIGADIGTVGFWRGPNEEAWDFVLSHDEINYQVEVKTSQYDKVKINSLKQLNSDIPVVSYLLLQKVNYQKTAIANENHTIISMIDEIRNLLTGREVLNEFLSKLEMICDFTDEDQVENCKKVVFLPKGEQWYLLDENFPILSDRTITDDVFRKISEVKYTLNLDSIAFKKSAIF